MTDPVTMHPNPDQLTTHDLLKHAETVFRADGHLALAGAMANRARTLEPRGGASREAAGAWFCYFADWSSFTAFETELEALRAAVYSDSGDLVLFIPFGEAARAYSDGIEHP